MAEKKNHLPQPEDGQTNDQERVIAGRKVGTLKSAMRNRFLRTGAAGSLALLGATHITPLTDQVVDDKTGLERRIENFEHANRISWNEMIEAQMDRDQLMARIREENQLRFEDMQSSLQRERQRLAEEHAQKLEEIEQWELFENELSERLETLRADIQQTNLTAARSLRDIGEWASQTAENMEGRARNAAISVAQSLLSAAETASEFIEPSLRQIGNVLEHIRHQIELYRTELEEQFATIERVFRNVVNDLRIIQNWMEKLEQLDSIITAKKLDLMDKSLYGIQFMLLLIIGFYLSRFSLERYAAGKLVLFDNVKTTGKIEDVTSQVEELTNLLTEKNRDNEALKARVEDLRTLTVGLIEALPAEDSAPIKEALARMQAEIANEKVEEELQEPVEQEA